MCVPRFIARMRAQTRMRTHAMSVLWPHDMQQTAWTCVHKPHPCIEQLRSYIWADTIERRSAEQLLYACMYVGILRAIGSEYPCMLITLPMTTTNTITTTPNCLACSACLLACLPACLPAFLLACFTVSLLACLLPFLACWLLSFHCFLCSLCSPWLDKQI